MADIEELRSGSISTQAEKDAADQARVALAAQILAVQTERDKLRIDLEKQTVLLKEYPQLADLAQYLPASNSIDEFRIGAKTFSAVLDKIVADKVKQAMAGSTPPVQRTQVDHMATEADEDKLYRLVTSLAGIPGKEREYEDARQKWVTLLNSKTA
jgi:hypothetical protein